MDLETVDRIIRFFEAVLERPGLYIPSTRDYQAFFAFRDGFTRCLSTLGLRGPLRSEFESVYVARGWQSSSVDIAEMKNAGLDDEGITREVMTTEVLLWWAFRETLI